MFGANEDTVYYKVNNQQGNEHFPPHFCRDESFLIGPQVKTSSECLEACSATWEAQLEKRESKTDTIFAQNSETVFCQRQSVGDSQYRVPPRGHFQTL